MKEILGNGSGFQLSNEDALRYQDALHLLRERRYIADIRTISGTTYRKMADWSGFEEWLDEEYPEEPVRPSVHTIPAETTRPEYDVFISHANSDKKEFVDELNESLKKLGIKIFYDKEALEWGDNWKDRILDGVQKAEFAIIVISENFFDREWTEKELTEFLSRQNHNGQKIILPILHNISVAQLQKKYPHIADIQAIDSSKYSCDEIALLFAKQLIKRLKNN